MTIQLIQSDSDFFNLKREWNALLKDSASHVPFLRHEYLFGWWKTLGGGEWDQGTLSILIERDVNNILVGVAPLFMVNHQVLFLGSVEISDYLDLITPIEHIPSFIERIFQFLTSIDFPEWHSLIFDNVLENSPSIEHIEKVAIELGFEFSQKVIQPAPYLPLPKTWNDYLNDLEDRYSHDVTRKIRKAEGYFLPIDWYFASDAETIANEMEDFLELMAFDFDDKIWVYNSGINPLFENLSPGWVLLSYLIQWSIQEGKTEFDFMRGDEAYKYQFGGINKNILQLKILK